MGKPAARLTDMHVCPMFTGPVPHVGGPIVAPGAPTVIIGGLPAARVGDMATCVGPPDFIAPPGAPTVLIGGMPAARMGDMTVHGGRVMLGCFTVLIGTSGARGSGLAGGAAAGPSCPCNCMSDAKKSAAPFVKMTEGPARNKYKQAPSLAEVTKDPHVDAELKRAWQESNPNVPEVPSGQPGSTKKEQGGWIIWNKKSGELQVKRVPAGTRDGLDPMVGTRPADNADQQVVAWFHTHPNTFNEGYSADPSPGDVGWQEAEAKVPGIIETHEGRKTIPYP